MRGRTLNDAFIILDEAQNTSPEQMKMFLTRLGFGSKIVVTGDVTQVDLPSGTRVRPAGRRGHPRRVEDVTFNRLTAHDVVRHRLVGKIVDGLRRVRRPAADGASRRTERRSVDELEHRGAQRVRPSSSTSHAAGRG